MVICDEIYAHHTFHSIRWWKATPRVLFTHTQNIYVKCVQINVFHTKTHLFSL